MRRMPARTCSVQPRRCLILLNIFSRAAGVSGACSAAPARDAGGAEQGRSRAFSRRRRRSASRVNPNLAVPAPKGTDLSAYAQRQLDVIARKLNRRPRETLGFKTPAVRVDAALR
jgi:hypothetical protein